MRFLISGPAESGVGRCAEWFPGGSLPDGREWLADIQNTSWCLGTASVVGPVAAAKAARGPLDGGRFLYVGGPPERAGSVNHRSTVTWPPHSCWRLAYEF